MYLAIDHLVIMVLNISNQLVNRWCCIVIIAIRHDDKLINSTRYSHIQAVRIGGKFSYFIIHRREYHHTFLLSLEFIGGIRFYRSTCKYFLQFICLIAVRRYDTDWTIICVQSLIRKNLVCNHIDLPLIDMLSRMISGHSPIHHKRLFISLRFCQHYQFIVIKTLIAESNNFGMAAIMLLQQYVRRVGKQRHDRR